MRSGLHSSARRWACLVLGLMAFGSVDGAPPPPAVPLRVADVVAHLARSISWYRRVAAVEQASQTPADSLARESAQRASARALQAAFDFGRASAPLVKTDQPTAAQASPDRLSAEQASSRAAQRIASVEARIAEVDAALAKAGVQARTTLTARRKELQAELTLARQIQEAAKGLRTFMSGQASAGGSDLSAYLDRLERSVPEAMRGVQPPPSPPAAMATAATNNLFRPESAGIFALITETLQMTGSRTQLSDAIAETDAMRKNLDQVRAPLVAELRRVIQRSDAAAADSASQDARQMETDRQEIEALTARFKLVSATLTPLREQGLLVETTRGSLLEYRNAIEQRYVAAIRYLIFRSLSLVGVIIVVLAISEMWRRGTFRYVRDPRRRKQFLLLRRVVVAGVIAASVIVGIVNELGSLATYAGFLTAGLAVALQNVIVSVVAYFFLIGRYGLRVGDRVTISGVTGDVLEIGLVRFYLMEIAGGGVDLQPTGRVVGFSNSVLFQPAALFRQMPGADYVWHTVVLTLAPDTDLNSAEQRLMAAVDRVYQQYRERIEQQHAAFQRLVDLPVSQPKPEARLRSSLAGIEFIVRYPAEMRRASAIDDQVVNALSDAIAAEPRLNLAPSGEPKLQAL